MSCDQKEYSRVAEEHVELVQRLFLQHMPELKAWVYTMIRNKDVADDLVQEMFLTIYKKADQFEAGTNFRAWMFAIGRFKLLEASRRPALKEVCFETDVLELLMPKPEEIVDNSDRIKILKSCIAKLPDSSRRAITLRYIESKKPPVIAEIMKWSTNAINVTLSRARISLRKCVDHWERSQSVQSGKVST